MNRRTFLKRVGLGAVVPLVERDGDYRLTLTRWPPESGAALNAPTDWTRWRR